MHGDGWADAMFLRGEAVAFHMVPYGWLRAPGTARPLIRGNFYKTIVVSCATPLQYPARGHEHFPVGIAAARAAHMEHALGTCAHMISNCGRP